jgi:transposase InsO family protein
VLVRRRDDNAMCESFFATLECELLERRRFTSKIEAKMACFSFIEGWYNPVRLHSALGYRSPMAYEAAMEAEWFVRSKKGSRGADLSLARRASR